MIKRVVDGVVTKYERKVRETTVEGRITDGAESLGWLVCKCERMSKKGWPDRVFIRKGRTVWIEVKKPGDEPDPQQHLRHREMRDHGAEVHWVDNAEAALRILA